MNEYIKEFLAGIVGVVEATSSEKHFLWKEYAHTKKVTWVSGGGGPGLTVGYIDKRPVCISLLVDVINGKKILFLEATSELVDWKMIDAWLKENTPTTALREGTEYVNKVTACNFFNLLR
jgi:hypothetical protein